MQTQCLLAVNPLGAYARAEDFLGVKRTQLKHRADQGISEKQGMEAVHVSPPRDLYPLHGAQGL